MVVFTHNTHIISFLNIKCLHFEMICNHLNDKFHFGTWWTEKQKSATGVRLHPVLYAYYESRNKKNANFERMLVHAESTANASLTPPSLPLQTPCKIRLIKQTGIFMTFFFLVFNKNQERRPISCELHAALRKTIHPDMKALIFHFWQFGCFPPSELLIIKRRTKEDRVRRERRTIWVALP